MRPPIRLIGILAVAVWGCSDGADPTGPGAPAVASLTISPDTVMLSGFGRQLHATATARDAAGNVVLAEVEWDLDDYSVASVSECGIILALSEGATNITARAGAVADTAFLIVDFPAAAASDADGLVPS